MKTTVVYVVREPLMAERFFRSYSMNRPAEPHKLLLVLKGRRAAVPPWFIHAHDSVRIADFGYDLRAYRVALRTARTEWVLLLNSHALIHSNCFLGGFEYVTDPERYPTPRPLMAVAGSASPESFYSNRPAWWRRLLFPPAPNWHARTNLLMVRRLDALAVWPRFTLTKAMCHLAESGRWSITRRLQRRGVVLSLPTIHLSDNRYNTDLMP